MFRTRLKWFSILVGLLATGLVARLFEIQIVRAASFDSLATRMVIRPEVFLSAPRGGILDRQGRVLISDVPTANICLHYGVIAGRDDYLEAVGRAMMQGGKTARDATLIEVTNQLRLEIDAMWDQISEISGEPRSALLERAQRIDDRVSAIREDQARRGNRGAIKEEGWFHSLLSDVPDEVALRIRETLGRLPWLRVVPSTRRVARDAEPLVHVLGRIGGVTPEHLADDPFRDDELRALRPGDACGISGVERLAEPLLRGTRGKIVEDISRTQLERVEPLQGRDVYLTIDADLQRRTLEILHDAVETSPNPAGASAVVIDPETREVLVLASYPVYPFEPTAQEYETLRNDARRLPLRFRAVSAAYPPGSTCKIATMVAGFAEGVTDENTRIHCTGYFRTPDSFRCWIYNEYPGVTHDLRGNPAGQNAEDAIRNSCNIYFFTLGDRLGAERLCAWFDRFGLGKLQGTGLIEESTGILPSADWLLVNRGRRFEKADAWNFSIGQGEVTATPLQAANVAASVATGRWSPVRILRGDVREALEQRLPPEQHFDESTLRVLRAGMWRVVNEPGGTAYVARLDRRDYHLCGKTGSAQASPRVLNWRFTYEWPGGRRMTVLADSREEALAQLPPGDPPRLVERTAAELFPAKGPEDKLPSHAWFVGYVQRADTPRGAPPRGRSLAISVLIEYGTSGGRNAGPVAKKIVEMVLSQLEDGVG
ncbi:MAG: penicillin-binding transpeptidase domain-containing protein [Phycisphaerae bacterium]